MPQQPVNADFSPNLFHPLYFVRSGLKKGIATYASRLSGRLLDFGCGSKPYKNLFQVDEYIGVDFENPGHSHQNELIDVFYDGSTLPFADASFDAVLCSEVMEHVFNLEEILAELRRVLKPAGTMLLTCPFVWNEHEVPFDYARYTRFALTHLLQRNGFEVVAYTKSGTFVPAIVQLVTLYFYTNFKGIWQRYFLLRVVYKTLFFLIPNAVGIVLEKVLPKNDSLYLNNVLLVQKSSLPV